MINNKETLTKTQLIREIAERGDFTLGDSRIFVNLLTEILEEAVLKKREVSIDSLFSFVYTPFKAGMKEVPVESSSSETRFVEVKRSERIYVRLGANIRRMSTERLRREEEREKNK